METSGGADRIAVMTKSPGAVKTVLDVDLDRPRTQTLRSSEDFAHIRARVAGILAEEVNVGNDAA